jgi:cytochrome c peroxidase
LIFPGAVIRAGIVMTISLLLHGCGGGNGAAGPVAATLDPTVTTPPIVATASSKAADLGRQIFSDTSLSASGRQSCATCHDPAHAHAPANDLAAQLGGPDMGTQGTRAAPSLRYLNLTPAFTLGADGSATGGFNRDGSAQTLAAQAGVPFLAAHEMANADPAAVIAKLQRASYAEQFRSVYGAAIFDDPGTAFERVLLALQQFQNQDSGLHPFDSKYDHFIAGRATLDAGELRGLALFNNPTKGNCAACHTSARSADGSAPLFTDFSFDNLGVPRNAELVANRDPKYFDLGLCGPQRSDLATRRDLCGAFKVPTLRNVATRQAFFHNGRFHTLHDVVSFYARRDTNPEEWYPRNADGSVEKFDDLPAALRANVNISEVPYNRQPGQAPALSPADIDDLVRFLSTLTDGYQIP